MQNRKKLIPRWRSLPLLLLPWTALANDTAPRLEPKSEPTAVEDLPKTAQLGMIMMEGPTAVVGGVECHSPAARAGLIGGSEIVEAGGTPIKNVEDFRRVLHRDKDKPSIEIAYRFAGFRAAPQKAKLVLTKDWWLPAPPKR
jgi:S1-C subfamily serine protease